MENDVQLYVALAYITVFLAIGYYFKRNSPTKINWIYGYTTRRCMANQRIWDAANTYWTRIFYQWQWYTLVIPIAVFFLFPRFTFIASVFGHSLLIILTMPATEVYLDKHFDKNGNPK